MSVRWFCFLCFFFNDTATTEIYTLSLHDALPIYLIDVFEGPFHWKHTAFAVDEIDRKSTRLNSSHLVISYAVFCLKKNSVRVRDAGHAAGDEQRGHENGPLADRLGYLLFFLPRGRAPRDPPVPPSNAPPLS